MSWSSSTLGAKTSTAGSAPASHAAQSTWPASLWGSGSQRSSEVTSPRSRTADSIARSSAPPSPYRRRMIGG